VPVANLGDDATVTMIDVFFGRLMQRNRHVLWASEGGSPDLGGVEGDENDLWADGDAGAAVSCAGAHRSVCVELELHNLCVDAIVASAQIDALEGTQVSGLGLPRSGARFRESAVVWPHGPCAGHRLLTTRRNAIFTRCARVCVRDVGNARSRASAPWT
jgi:hypothetical protein